MNRQSYMEISKDNFKYNIKQIRDYVGNKEIMPIIKANGYGTHVNKCLELIEYSNNTAEHLPLHITMGKDIANKLNYSEGFRRGFLLCFLQINLIILF